MFCRDIKLMGAVFPAHYDAILNMLPDRSYSPVRVAPGHGLVAIHCIEYRDSDVGPYNEVALSLMIDHGSGMLPGPVRVALYNLRDDYHAFVQDLPVNTEISVQGGRTIFNYPKYLANISFQETTTHRICLVKNAQTQELILEMTCARLNTRIGRKLITLNSYPVIAGQKHHARMLVNLREYGIAYLLHHATLRFGEDEHSLSYKQLALGRSLHHIYAPQGEAILMPPTPIDGQG